jgi:hypothetical protein
MSREQRYDSQGIDLPEGLPELESDTSDYESDNEETNNQMNTEVQSEPEHRVFNPDDWAGDYQQDANDDDNWTPRPIRFTQNIQHAHNIIQQLGAIRQMGLTPIDMIQALIAWTASEMREADEAIDDNIENVE